METSTFSKILKSGKDVIRIVARIVVRLLYYVACIAVYIGYMALKLIVYLLKGFGDFVTRKTSTFLGIISILCSIAGFVGPFIVGFHTSEAGGAMMFGYIGAFIFASLAWLTKSWDDDFAGISFTVLALAAVASFLCYIFYGYMLMLVFSLYIGGAMALTRH
ncbi:MAG: hypothetical protein Q4B26_00315 [Eubacteriales bacterium]|nr:hypothetical protein [Eubacteriales bacterium]